MPLGSGVSPSARYATTVPKGASQALSSSERRGPSQKTPSARVAGHEQTKPRALLDVLREEKAAGTPGGIYHHVQVEFAYNSNHIEGSQLTHEQTRLIFETNTIGVADAVRVDDILETANHFR